MARSPVTTIRAHFGPIARRAFVPPVRPEPIVRGSGAPVSLETMTLNGIDPMT